MGLSLKLSPDLVASLRGQQQQQQKKQEPVATNTDFAAKQHAEEKPLPAISIQVERLLGYTPLQDELDSVRDQLVHAMWQRYRGQDYAPSTRDQNDENPSSALETLQDDDTSIPPPDFDEHVLDLLQTGIARWTPKAEVDETSSSSATTILKLHYPPTVYSPTTETLEDTRKVYSELMRHPLSFSTAQETIPDFVHKIYSYLKTTHRGLLWRRDMAQELHRILRQEQTHWEYQQWQESQLQDKLDNLYNVRETLLHQVDQQAGVVKDLESKRDKAVAEALTKQRAASSGKGGLQGFDMESTILSFPDEFALLGLSTDEAAFSDEEDWGLGEDDDDSGYGGNSSSDADSGYGTDGAGEQSQASDEDKINLESNYPEAAIDTEDDKISGDDQEATPSTSLSLPFRKRKGRAKKKRQQQRTARKEQEHQRKLEQAKAEEEAMIKKLTSSEMIIAQTLLKALQEKMKTVDELVESLQEEAWAAEEDAEQALGDSKDESGPSFSLLDQILAMILGGLPVKEGTTQVEHFQFIQREHQSIVEEWKEYFGRLPQAFTPGAEEDDNEQDEDKSDGEELPNFATMIDPNEKEPSPPPLPVAEVPLSVEDQRAALGLVENDNDEWDASDDEK